MASRACRTLTGPLKGRLFASQASPAQAEVRAALPKQTPKLTKLPNGLLVASLENYSPVSQVSVVVNGGSRFEEGRDLGVTHCLRIAAGLSTNYSTKFGLTKNIQQLGGDMKVTATREYLYYTVDCNRDEIEKPVEYLRDITTSPAFKPWEVSEIQSKLALDIGVLKTQPEIRVFEMLHKGAFRNTLGNSLYAPKFMIGKYSSEQLMHYVRNHYTTGRIALVGVGVDHEYLVSEANKFKLFDGTGDQKVKTVYHGGEMRKNTANDLTYTALAVQGPSLSSKDLLSAGILQNIMGSGTRVHYGNNAAKIGQAVGAVTSAHHSVSCFSANYTDGGLFGFFAITQPEDAEKVMKTVMEQFTGLTKTGIKDQEFARGKNQLKSQIAMFFEKRDNLLIDLAEQAMGGEQFTSMEDMYKKIDSIKPDEVLKVAKNMLSGKPTMATLGNLSHAPYMDQLIK